MTRSPFYRLNILIIFTVLFAILALLNYFFVPTYVENIVLQNFALSPNSASYGSWQQSNIPIYTKFYFFNLTNAKAVLQGQKPILEEVGPYTFRYAFQKVNISWDEQNGTVQYRTVKRWIYEPAMNNRSLDDEIVHFNVPLMSAVYAIQASPQQEHYTAFESLNSLVEAYKMSAILRNKIRHLLFDGYHDSLLEAASNFYPNQVKQRKFGWFYGRNNTSSDGLYRIFTGQNGNGRKLGLLDTWNGERILSSWPSGETCRSLERSSAGDLQPPFFLMSNSHLLDYLAGGQTELPKNLRMFIGDMCRSLDLDLKRPVTFKNLAGFQYRAGPDLFNYSREQNQCFCLQQRCPPTGLYDMGVCAKGSPIFMSYPHFLHAETSLRDQVRGLAPSESKHEFYLDYEKNLAIPMNLRIRLQVNLLIRKNSQIEIMENWPDKFELYLPQFWSSTSANLDGSVVSQLDFLVNKLPLLMFLTTVALAIVAILLLCYICFVAFSSQMFLGVNQSIPKYESVSILPNIETSKEGTSDYSMQPL